MVDYDVAIIGAGIAGLTAGALLAEKGFKVIILEKNDSPGGFYSSYKDSGFIFDLSATFIGGLEEGGLLNQLLFRLGILKELQDTSLLKLDPGYQVILPNHRIDLYSEREALFAELKREFPNDITKFRHFYDEVDKIDDFISEKRPHYNPFEGIYTKHCHSGLNAALSPIPKKNTLTSDYIRQWVSNKELNAFISLQTQYFGCRTINEAPVPLASVMLGIPRKNAYYIKGGIQALAYRLASAIKDLKGNLIYNANVRELLMEKGVPLGVVADYKSISAEIRAHCIVSDSPYSSVISNLIKDNKAKKRFKEAGLVKSNMHIPVSILLGVDEKVIPDPMKENIFYLSDYNCSNTPENYIYISVSPSWDKGRAPRGKRALTITTYIDSSSIKPRMWKNFLEREAEDLLERVAPLLPFLKDYTVFKKILSPMYYQDVTLKEEYEIVLKDKVFYKGKGNPVLSRLFFINNTDCQSLSIPSAVKSGMETACLVIGDTR